MAQDSQSALVHEIQTILIETGFSKSITQYDVSQKDHIKQPSNKDNEKRWSTQLQWCDYTAKIWNSGWTHHFLKVCNDLETLMQHDLYLKTITATMVLSS